jgi:hypothetical protein
MGAACDSLHATDSYTTPNPLRIRQERNQGKNFYSAMEHCPVFIIWCPL